MCLAHAQHIEPNSSLLQHHSHRLDCQRITGNASHLSRNAKSQLIITTETYKNDYSNQHGLGSTPYPLAAMSSTHLTPMDSEEAYQSLMERILADEPSTQDGLLWDRIALSLTASSPTQRHINYLSEAASHQLLGQLTDTLCRMFMHDSNNLAALTTRLFQGYTAAIAGMPRRVVELRTLRGKEFFEGVRRMVEERWVVPGGCAGMGGY